jgi:FkbM family methyltransferase
MARDFDYLIAFEPMPSNADCWEANLHESENVELHRVALGETDCFVSVKTRTVGSSGDTGVDFSGTQVQQKRLDDFGLQHVDFIKCDCEGYEMFVMRGAVETIKRCRPVIIVEQKPHTGGPQRYHIGEKAAVDYLVSLGMTVRAERSGDYVMAW